MTTLECVEEYNGASPVSSVRFSKEQYTSQTKEIPEEYMYMWGSFVEIKLDSVLPFDGTTVLVL